MKINHLFVYGTLRKGFQNNPYLALIQENGSFVGKASVGGLLYNLGEYPGAKPDKRFSLKGEVYRIKRDKTDEILEKLDDYEDYKKEEPEKSLFVRKAEKILLKNNRVIDAWVYWYNFPVKGRRRISTGDYLQHLQAVAV